MNRREGITVKSRRIRRITKIDNRKHNHKKKSNNMEYNNTNKSKQDTTQQGNINKNI